MIYDSLRDEIARTASTGSADELLAVLLRVRAMYDSSESIEERAILRPLLDQLRAASGGHVKALSDKQLAKKLLSARKRLEAAIESRLDPNLSGAGGGMGGGAIDPVDHARINRAIDEASNHASLQASYRELLRELSHRQEVQRGNTHTEQAG